MSIRNVPVICLVAVGVLFLPTSASAAHAPCTGVPHAGGLWGLCNAGLAIGCDAHTCGPISRPCQNIIDTYTILSGGDPPPWAVLPLCGFGFANCVTGTFDIDEVGYPSGVANKSGDFDHLLGATGLSFGLAFDATSTDCLGFHVPIRFYKVTDFEFRICGDTFMETTFSSDLNSIGSLMDGLMFLEDVFPGQVVLGIHVADTSKSEYTFELFVNGLTLNSVGGCPVLDPLPASNSLAFDLIFLRKFTLDWPSVSPAFFRDGAFGPADLEIH